MIGVYAIAIPIVVLGALYLVLLIQEVREQELRRKSHQRHLIRHPANPSRRNIKSRRPD